MYTEDEQYIDVTTNELPGCCAFTVAHEFPFDEDIEKKDLDLITKEVTHLIADEGANLITLNNKQKTAASLITKLGFRAIGTVAGESGPVTLFVKGMRLMPTTVGVAKKVAKKRVAKKTTRK